MSLTTTINKIKQYGPDKAQVISDTNNKLKIIIDTPQGIVTLLRNLDKNIAEDIIRQAKDRLILG